jgi:hypothetical protein
VYVLASLCLAAKQNSTDLPLNKLIKFAAYKFTVDQLEIAETQIYETLNYNVDMNFRSDDLYGMTMVSLNVIR